MFLEMDDGCFRDQRKYQENWATIFFSLKKIHLNLKINISLVGI